MTISLLDLLRPRGLPLGAAVKIARHKEAGIDLQRLEATGHFEYYQRVQGSPVFDRCDYLVSCIGGAGREAVFKGVFQVGARTGPKRMRSPVGFPYPSWPTIKSYEYQLTSLPHFQDLVDRVVLDWGEGTRSWVQWLQQLSGMTGRDREVLEIRRPRTGRMFPGYRQVNLTLPELSGIMTNPRHYVDWHQALAAVSGVYISRDEESGEQYVGSASGRGGLLARWLSYAKSKHGGNRRLQELLRASPERWSSLSIAILAVMDLAENADAVLERESEFKRKLGTRAHGLNAN